jgi:hypothetical protein
MQELAGVPVKEEKGEVMVDSGMIKSYIDKMVSLADDMEYTPEMVKGLQDLKAKLSDGKMSVEDALSKMEETIKITGDEIDAVEALGQAVDYDDTIVNKAREIRGLNEEEKENLNEHYIAGGIVGIGALNGGVPRKKSDYEMAFEHFIGEGYDTKEVDEAKEEIEEAKDITKMSVEEFMEEMLGPDYRKKPQEKQDMVSKVYNELKRVNSLKESEEEIEEDNLGHNIIASLRPEGRFWIVSWRGMDGTKEKAFTDEDKARAFMNTLEEGKEVEEPSLYEAEEENSSKSSASTLGKDLRNLGSSLDTKGIQGKEADNLIKFIKKALESIQTNNLNSDTAWSQLSAKLDTLAGEKSK